MGLTIHYQLTTTTGDEAYARKLVQQLRPAALGLPFAHAGEIAELRGDQCDWKPRAWRPRATPGAIAPNWGDAP